MSIKFGRAHGNGYHDSVVRKITVKLPKASYDRIEYEISQIEQNGDVIHEREYHQSFIKRICIRCPISYKDGKREYMEKRGDLFVCSHCGLIKVPKGIEYDANEDTCFIQGSSTRARDLNDRLNKFKEKALKEGVKVGKIKHIAFSPTKALIEEILTNYNSYLKFRKEIVISTILEESGLFAGVLIFDLWSKQCKICGKKEHECSCNEKDLERVISPHFHYIGYGYILHTNDFREKFKDWVYVNFGSRDDAYHTIFYALTHCAMWRKENGKLKPAYEFAGFLRPKHLEPIHAVTKYIPHTCKVCKQPTRRIMSGLTRVGKFPHAIQVHISEGELKLGSEIRYKALVRSYRICHIELLRDVVEINKIRYEKYKRKRKKNEVIEKKGSGYG
ncbi:MAG: hypothetical protein HWN79_04230 [Candidatus Lokiarchaeota archaeon]|nr:hypothetical protein [Candidatus Lokiarchaeota archaeon]